jgi:hypothetical protein
MTQIRHLRAAALASLCIFPCSCAEGARGLTAEGAHTVHEESERPGTVSPAPPEGLRSAHGALNTEGSRELR